MLQTSLWTEKTKIKVPKIQDAKHKANAIIKRKISN